MTGWESQLRKGVVELAVLASIGHGESYGYRIVSDLQRLDGLELTESTVYPVLARLAREGILAIRTEESPAGPNRRVLSADGGGSRTTPPDDGELEDGFRVPQRIT